MHKLAGVVLVLVAGTASAENPDPTLTFAAPKVTGTYDAKALGATLKKASAKLVGCYRKTVSEGIGTKSTETVTFKIQLTGKVSDVVAEGVLGSEFHVCASAVFAKLVLAKPKAVVDVTSEVTFEPHIQIGALAGTGTAESGFDDPNFNGGRTGVATVGSGRYGTIGHGSGTGSSYGVGGSGGLRDANPSVPTISIGQPQVTGGELDKAIIRRYIKRNIQKVMYCYEKQLLAKPKLQGTVTADFTIGPEGLVTAATAAGMGDKEVESCVAGVIKAIEFPKPKNAVAVTVKYPFEYKLPAKQAAPAKP